MKGKHKMHVTVCICTRNRGASIEATLRSLLASSYTDFDVVIVDQSIEEDTAQAVQVVIAGDSRFNYLRSATAGKTVALNVALGQAQGPLIAFTDDDCEVGPEWLERLVAHFERHPQVAEICGTVRAILHDPSTGYVPDFEVRQQEEISSPWQMWRAQGMGANMAFRQEALQAVGPYDEMLGPGGVFYTGEDTDMSCRMLEAGYHILHVPDAVVLHSGFRRWDETGKLYIRHSFLSIGVAHMKLLRMGVLAALPALLHTFVFHSVNWSNLFLRWKFRIGWGNVLAYVQGLAHSFRYKVDRRRGVYLPR